MSPEKEATSKRKLRGDRRQAIADFRDRDKNMTVEFEVTPLEDVDVDMIGVEDGDILQTS
jgi:hypothetical protein